MSAYSQSCGFSSGHVWMWKLDHKEGRGLKNWCFWTAVLENTLKSSLNSKIKPVNAKGNQSWMFTVRTAAEAEASILLPPDLNWFIGKDPDAGKDWRQEQKTVAEDEMVGWHCRLNGDEFQQTWGDSEGQGSLVYCSPWGHKKTQLSNWTISSSFD